MKLEKMSKKIWADYKKLCNPICIMYSEKIIMKELYNNKKTILYIGGKHCTSVNQLKDYFSDDLIPESDIYADLLDYGRHGDIAKWLREMGEANLASSVDAIDTSLSDSAFYGQLKAAITGIDDNPAPLKPPFEKCFSFEDLKCDVKDNEAKVAVSLKVLMCVNEEYELSVSSNWGTRAELVNPYNHPEGKTASFTFTLRKCPGKDVGEITIMVDGKVLSSDKSNSSKCGKNLYESTLDDPVCCKCEYYLCKLKKGNTSDIISKKQDVPFEKEKVSDKEWSADDVRKLERFFPQYKGGLDYIGKSGEDYLFYGYKDKLRERNNADIVTSLGKMLFVLKKEDGIVVSGVLPSGLLILEKCDEDGTTYYGIVCKYGKILIPCEKGEHKCRVSDLRVFEKSPGVIQFPYEKYSINAYTREQYVDVAGDYGLKIKSEDNDSLIDIVNVNNSGIIASDATIDNEPGLRKLGNGWYLVKVLKRTGKGEIEKVSMVFNEEKLLFLDEKEAIMEAGSEYFINNDRIISTISYRESGYYNEWSYFSEIRIRDYSGNIIKVISSPQLYITDPYNHGKLAAFIIGEHEMAKSLVYFDMQGNEHRIPFNVERFHYSNLRAYFISETELQFINGKSWKRSCLINI